MKNDDDTYRWLDNPESRVIRWIAWRLLHFAEWLMLLTYGWQRTAAPAEDALAWSPPPEHPKAPDLYGRSHAVNSMRYYIGRQLRGARPKRHRQRRRHWSTYDVGDNE